MSYSQDIYQIIKETAPDYFLCVDGGGTKTHVSLLDWQGEPLLLSHNEGEATTELKLGCSNVTLIGTAGAGNLVTDIFEKSKVKIQKNWIDISEIKEKCMVHAGFAGAGTYEIQQELTEVIRSKNFVSASVPFIHITSDIGLYKMVAEEGVFLSAGTGTIAYLKLKNHPELRVDGDHWLLGSDKGGAVNIGQSAMLKALDIERDTLLQYDGEEFTEEHKQYFMSAILNCEYFSDLNCLTVQALSRNILDDLKNMDIRKLICLPPLVFNLAYGQGNTVARSILKEAAQNLNTIIKKCALHIPPHQSLPLYLSGGLFKNKHVSEFIKDIKLDENQFTIHNLAEGNMAVKSIKTVIQFPFLGDLS